MSRKTGKLTDGLFNQAVSSQRVKAVFTILLMSQVQVQN